MMVNQVPQDQEFQVVLDMDVADQSWYLDPASERDTCIYLSLDL